MVAVDRAHLARPGIEQHEVALGRAFENVAFIVDECRLDAEERQRRRARLLRDRTRQRRDQGGAGFGLPPGVDDRTTAFADDAVVPLPGFRIDRLADRAEQADAPPRRALHRCLALAH